MKMGNISVVVPVKNARDSIGRCLEAVLSQTVRPSEVLVVDGHSTDGTVHIAQKFPVTILCEEYGTIGGARQVGLENARGDFIAFTDADCIPTQHWLEHLLVNLNDTVVGVGGGTRNVAVGLWGESITFALDSFLGSARSVQDRISQEKRSVKSISGCNSMYRRDALLKVGGFDTTLSVNEDTELNNRLTKCSTLLYVPDAVVSHDQNRGVMAFIKRMFFFGYGRGSKRLWDLQVIPPIVGALSLLLIFLSLKVFFAIILLYVLTVTYFDIKIFFKAKKFKFLLSLPLIFVLEHLSYTLGFWKGILLPQRGLK
jgi:glycosyltransferase involved in cell wall biosynthesis